LAEERILVTGGNGFVGRALCQELEHAGVAHLRAVRHSGAGRAPIPGGGSDILVGDIGSRTNWDNALQDVSAIVHLAARTHVMRETTTDPAGEYRELNVEGTRNLAQAAARSGVKNLIFISSVKVNGEHTGLHPFRETDEPRPEDAYGRSKLEAEQVLWGIAKDSGLKISVIRPPLMYGPGVKGNILTLLRTIERGWPLPLASVRNRRSLLYVGNLVSAIMACLVNPRSAGQTFLVSDGAPVSTPELICCAARSLARPARLFPCPPSLFAFAGSVLGKRDQVSRLTGSLEVDSSLIRQELGWLPAYTFEQGMAETADWFQSVARFP